MRSCLLLAGAALLSTRMARTDPPVLPPAPAPPAAAVAPLPAFAPLAAPPLPAASPPGYRNKRMMISGIVLTSLGVAMLGVGLGLYGANATNDDSAAAFIGLFALVPVSNAFLGVGIPLWALGARDPLPSAPREPSRRLLPDGRVAPASNVGMRNAGIVITALAIASVPVGIAMTLDHPGR